MPTMITLQTEIPSDRPSISTSSTSTMHSNTMVSGSTDPDRSPTAQTTSDTSVGSDMTSSSINPMSTNPSTAMKPDSTLPNNNQNVPSTFSSGSIPTTNMYPNTVDSTKMPGPPTMITTMDRFPSTASTYGSTNTDVSTNEVKPPTYPTFMNGDKPNDFTYPYPPNYHTKYPNYHEMYPFYNTYPTYYDTSYPNGYGPGGGSYASNAPTASYQPTFDYHGTTPSMSPYGGSSVPNTATTYMGNGWSNAGETGRRTQNGSRYPDFDNSGTFPGGKYNGTRSPSMIPYIRTYFNPDDYYINSKSEYKSTMVLNLIDRSRSFIS